MGYTWVQMGWIVLIYSCLGWCCEVAFAALKTGKFVNRGFLNGPVCPIYGFGVLSVVLVLEPVKDNLLLLFFGSMVFTSLLEFIAGFAMERIFHDKWWDYSNNPFNIKGYICLEFSLAWGVACVVVVDLIHPLIVKLVNLVPMTLGWILLAVFGTAWVADHIVTIIEVCKLPKRLRAIQAIEDALTAVSDEIGENIYRGASGAKARGEELHADLAEKNAEFKQAMQEKAAEHRQAAQERGEAYRQSLEARRAELLQKREELLGRRNYVHDRINKAFPALREGKTYGRAFTKLHDKFQERKNGSKDHKAE